VSTVAASVLEVTSAKHFLDARGIARTSHELTQALSGFVSQIFQVCACAPPSPFVNFPIRDDGSASPFAHCMKEMGTKDDRNMRYTRRVQPLSRV